MAYAMLNRRLEKMAKNADCPFISAEGGRMDVMEAAQVDAIQTQADYKNWKPALTAIEQELRRAIEFGFNKEELAEARSNILSLIHISEPTRLGMISYAVFCLKKKKKNTKYREYSSKIT